MEVATHPNEVKKRPALGKGIESLLGPRPVAAAPGAAAEVAGKPLEIALDRIEKNPYQTRTAFDPEKMKELTQSVAATGVVQPIVVRELGGGRYQLIMGERRWRASQAAGRATIPAIVRQVSDEQAMEMTIIENLQRADLNPMEQARAFDRLGRDFRMTQEQIALRTGKERATVANFLRLLRLTKSIQNLIESGELTYGHGKALLALELPVHLTDAVDRILKDHLSVRQTEEMVMEMLNPEGRPVRAVGQRTRPDDANVRSAEDRLQQRLGMRVRIEDKRGKGRVIIEYSGVDDFDSLLSVLGA